MHTFIYSFICSQTRYLAQFAWLPLSDAYSFNFGFGYCLYAHLVCCGHNDLSSFYCLLTLFTWETFPSIFFWLNRAIYMHTEAYKCFPIFPFSICQRMKAVVQIELKQSKETDNAPLSSAEPGMCILLFNQMEQFNTI